MKEIGSPEIYPVAGAARLPIWLIAVFLMYAFSGHVAHAQGFAELALAGGGGGGMGLYPQAQVSSLFPEQSVTPEQSRPLSPLERRPKPSARSPSRHSTSDPPATPRQSFIADTIQKFSRVIWASNQMSALGYERPSSPPVDSATRDVTAIQMQLQSFAADHGLSNPNVLEEGARRAVETAFVNAELDGIRRAIQAGGDLAQYAGVYRRYCNDLGYKGQGNSLNMGPGSFSNQFDLWSQDFDLWSQDIIYFQPGTVYIAQVGTTRFRGFPIRSSQNLPTVKDGVVFYAMQIKFFDDHDQKEYALNFLPNSVRFDVEGHHFEKLKCLN
jgi:hypothetical protein